MNAIDRTQTLKFDSTIELANWLSENILNSLRQDQLMREGIEYHDQHGIYQITIELSAKQLILLKDITEFELSVRAINALKAHNINTIEDLVALVHSKHRYRKILNIGTKTRQEIDELLIKLDVYN